MLPRTSIIAGLLCLCVSASALANIYTVTNTHNSGAGSLRAAIHHANNHPNAGPAKPDRIHFNIPGEGVQRIAPLTQLPAIKDPVVIDGYTQPGSSVNTKRNSDDAVLLIELHGGQSAGEHGLVLKARSTVSGLVINGFSGDGLRVAAGAGHIIAGNFIGTDAAGLTGLPNGVGVALEANATVGGISPADRNVISGNTSRGVLAVAGSATIQGNFIGTTATGTSSPENNTQYGVRMIATGGIIGGAEPGAGNVISGNLGGGIDIHTDTPDDPSTPPTVVVGNRIGTTAAGTEPLGNKFGLVIRSPAKIGLLDDGTTKLRIPNTIAYNGPFGGIKVAASGVTMTRNRIYGNSNLGIDLDEDGVTMNDQGDLDDGANGLQNYPLLTSASVDQGKIAIAGSFNSKPDQTYRIEFFASGAADKTGYGEGRWFIGAVNVTTDGAGNATFNFSRRFHIGSTWATATATDAAGNTSEFSQAVQITRPPGAADAGAPAEDADED